MRRRTSGGPKEARVLLLDTIGELGQVYSVAKVAFVGGSLCPKGGHNPLEPASMGKAVVFGPHMENFKEIASALLRANGARQVRDSLELEKCLEELLRDPLAAEQMGRRARAVLEANRGATSRTIALLEDLMGVQGS
jgi:3-deoxy-D-manno-octulosonic-acid transferase